MLYANEQPLELLTDYKYTSGNLGAIGTCIYDSTKALIRSQGFQFVQQNNSA